MSDKLDVIRKLLAKAERAATEHEAETYTAKAFELMARHGIDEALLAASGEKPDQITERRISMQDPYSAGKARLLGWTATALGAKWIMHGARNGKVASVTVYGWESDLDRIEMLYTSLLLQATTQLVKARPAWPGESVAAYRRSWLQGFAAKVHQRLSEAEEKAKAAATDASTGTPGTALVLVTRAEQVEKGYASRFANVRFARKQKLTGTGYYAGAEAGARADLGGPRLSKATRRTALAS